MKKKILMLIMLVFLLCGCNAKVDIKIDKYTVDETITINDYANVDTTKDMILAKYRKYIPVDSSVIVPDTEPDERISGVKYYTRTYNDVGNGYSFVYKYNHNFDEYYTSTGIKSAYKSSYLNYDRVDNKIIVIGFINKLLFIPALSRAIFILANKHLLPFFHIVMLLYEN